MTSRKPNPGATPAERRLWAPGWYRARWRGTGGEGVRRSRSQRSATGHGERGRTTGLPGRRSPRDSVSRSRSPVAYPSGCGRSPWDRSRGSGGEGRSRRRWAAAACDGEGAKANRGAASKGADVPGDRERARAVVLIGEAGIRLMGAVVRHRAPSMSSIVRTRIRTRDFTPQLVPSTGQTPGNEGREAPFLSRGPHERRLAGTMSVPLRCDILTAERLSKEPGSLGQVASQAPVRSCRG